MVVQTQSSSSSVVFRPGSARGTTRLSWLNSRHTFSFGDYQDLAFTRFGTLRVLNDDWVAPGGGFAPHSHRDMEIVSIVLDGALEHRDSLGNGSIIQAGEVQRMSAGTGIQHSEFNPSDETAARFLQVWFFPSAAGLPPGYEQARFDQELARQDWQVLVDPTGANGALRINQQVRIFQRFLADGESATWQNADQRLAWVHVASGQVLLDEGLFLEGQQTQSSAAGDATTGCEAITLVGGDAVGLKGQTPLTLQAVGDQPSHVLVFEVTEREAG